MWGYNRVVYGFCKGFSVGAELQQGCVMSPWLFNTYMHIWMRGNKLNARMFVSGFGLVGAKEERIKKSESV